MRISIIILAVALNATSLFSQQQTIRIFGQAPDYSNYSLVFERHQNYISYDQVELFTIEVDKNGKFDFTTSLDQITFAFTDLDQFRGLIYLEPGKEYELKLPPFHRLSQAQKLNPFFEPEQILLGILNEDKTGLNSMIRDFDEAYDYQLSKNAVKLISSRHKTLTNNIIDTLQIRFANQHKFFNDHKHFRYARIEMLSSRNHQRDVIPKYFSDKPVQFSMPAYWESFRDVFSGFGRKLFGRQEFSDSISFAGMVQSIKKDTVFKRTDLTEALIVWSLHEGYHEKFIPREKALHLLARVGEEALTPEIRRTALIIYNSISALQEKSKAPDFSLFTFSGERKSLNDYKGKFVYLNFMHTDNYACRRDLKLLPRIREKFKRDLEIVTVLINDDYDKAKQFTDNTEDMEWDFLFFGRKANILKDYNVQAVPIYYLIDPDGKLILSPSPTPGENFHDKFINQYRKYQRKQQRQNPQKKRSIFGK